MAKFDSPKKFLAHLKQQQPAPRRVLVASKERIRRDAFRDELAKIVFAAQERKKLEIVRTEGKSLRDRQLIAFFDELRSLSLFSPARFFVISNAESIPTSSIDSLLEETAHLSGDVFVLFESEKILASHKLRKSLQAKDLYLECSALKDADLRKWTSAQLRAAGAKGFENSVPDRLIEIGEQSPDTIANLCTHLVTYVGDAEIQERDIFAVFIAHPDPNEFTLLDMLARGELAQAEVLIRQLVSSGKSPFLLVSMLGRTISNYLSVNALARDGKSDAQIQAQLEIKPWAYKKTRQALRHYPVWKLEQLAEALLAADSTLKNRSLGPEEIVGELSYQLCP